MKFQVGNMLLVLIALMALTSCEVTRDIMGDTISSVDTGMDDVMDMTSPIDAEMDDNIPDIETAAVKLLWLINYPLGGKDAYISWVESIAPTLQAPAELNRLASYDNFSGENPHRLVEFEFGSIEDASTYVNRPDIAAIFEALPDHTSEGSTHLYIQRSDYSKNQEATRQAKLVYLIDYPLGGKAEYLEWVASVVPALQAPAEVKRIASYDNYYGISPHRLVEFEFDSIEDANSYQEQEEVKTINAELPIRTGAVREFKFELRSDYINE